MKISDLYKINKLEQKASCLCNHRVEPEMYDFYSDNDIEWLFENEEKIEKDFSENLKEMEFHVIMNTTLDEGDELVLKLGRKTVEEFSSYINFIPYRIMSKSAKNEINKLFEEFKKKDPYEKLEFFRKIRR